VLRVDLRWQRGAFRLEAAFTAPTPGLTALYGRSGAGKTTLVHLLAGLLRPLAGFIELDGRRLFDSGSGADVPTHRRRLACVFQDLRLFPHLDVAGNLRYGLTRARLEAPPRIQLARVIEMLDLDALLRRRSWQLSGGERQRVALGRALLAQPRLLLLDEPLASIDVAKRSELMPYFERLRDELAVPMILVTHQFEDVVRLATHVVLLDGGRVQAEGDLPSVSRRPELSALLGADGVGAVIEGEVAALDPTSGLATIAAGENRIVVPADGLRPGRKLRLQLLARDLILASSRPTGLSVRNLLHGTVTGLDPDPPHNMMVSLDAGGLALLARVTTAAATELQLHAGQPLWILVKAVSLRAHQR
jgi:molybdate transport system ATP-binding protein